MTEGVRRDKIFLLCRLIQLITKECSQNGEKKNSYYLHHSYVCILSTDTNQEATV